MPVIENSKLLQWMNMALGTEMVGITLPGFILLDGQSDTNLVLLTHEKIHMEQYKDLYYIGFVFVYAYDYIRNRLRGLSPQCAYMNTRAEIEAYENECDPGYLARRVRRKWLNR